jgi:hypothetical protein
MDFLVANLDSRTATKSFSCSYRSALVDSINCSNTELMYSPHFTCDESPLGRSSLIYPGCFEGFTLRQSFSTLLVLFHKLLAVFTAFVSAQRNNTSVPKMLGFFTTQIGKAQLKYLMDISRIRGRVCYLIKSTYSEERFINSQEFSTTAVANIRQIFGPVQQG